MNFIVQVLIQDLENMGRFPQAVAREEWIAKWNALKDLAPAEFAAVQDACSESTRFVAWTQVRKHDPDPAKTARSTAFESLFGKT